MAGRETAHPPRTNHKSNSKLTRMYRYRTAPLLECAANVLLRHPDRGGDLGVRGAALQSLPNLFSLYPPCIFESRAHLFPRLFFSLPVSLTLSFNGGVDRLLDRSDPLRSNAQATKRPFLSIRGFGHVADRS